MQLCLWDYKIEGVPAENEDIFDLKIFLLTFFISFFFNYLF